MRRNIALALALALATTPLRAEVLKFAIPQGNSLKLTWWPRFVMPKGWHQEEGPSLHYDAAALVPDGKNFADADAVLVIKAQLKAAARAKTLSDLIKSDTEGYAKAAPDITVARAEDIADADGKVFYAYNFTPPQGRNGNFEVTAYAEEGDYFLLFTLSAPTRGGYDKNYPVFKQLVRDYAEKLPDGK